MASGGAASLSPNFGSRRGGARPALIVLHYTGMQSSAAALERLCDPVAEVSAHYLISETGEVVAIVPEEMRAWHAGAGAWRGWSDVNSVSIGIELANTGAHPFPEPQMRALEALLDGVRGRWGIAPEGVIAHADMAPGRKTDPGPRFDWCRLARAGHAVWPGPGGDPEAPLARSLARFGYPPVDQALLLASFRLRFRPWAVGAEDATDRRLADDLACRFGDGAPGAAQT